MWFIILVLITACNAEQAIVKADEVTKSLANGKSVQFKNTIIDGDLDFGKAGNRIDADIRFEKCVFKGNVKAEALRFYGSLIFTESEFQKEMNFQDVSIFGAINFNRSVFKGKTIFASMTAWAKNSYFSEIKASKRFSLEASDFHGNLSIMDSEFADAFSLQEAFVQGNLQGSNAKFEGNTDFAMLIVLRRAMFKYSNFKTKPDFSNAKAVLEM
jgi:predicted transcriptional regulator with HTH domain